MTKKLAPKLTLKNVGLLVLTLGLVVTGFQGGVIAMAGAGIAILGFYICLEADHGPFIFQRRKSE